MRFVKRPEESLNLGCELSRKRQKKEKNNTIGRNDVFMTLDFKHYKVVNILGFNFASIETLKWKSTGKSSDVETRAWIYAIGGPKPIYIVIS